MISPLHSAKLGLLDKNTYQGGRGGGGGGNLVFPDHNLSEPEHKLA